MATFCPFRRRIAAENCGPTESKGDRHVRRSERKGRRGGPQAGLYRGRGASDRRCRRTFHAKDGRGVGRALPGDDERLGPAGLGARDPRRAGRNAPAPEIVAAAPAPEISACRRADGRRPAWRCRRSADQAETEPVSPEIIAATQETEVGNAEPAPAPEPVEPTLPRPLTPEIAALGPAKPRPATQCEAVTRLTPLTPEVLADTGTASTAIYPAPKADLACWKR